MTQIYKFITTANTVALSGSVNTHRVAHGLMRQMLIQAETSGVIFRANITDSDGDIVRTYDYARDQINDTGRPIPMTGVYTVNILNASQDGRFRIKMMVHE